MIDKKLALLGIKEDETKTFLYLLENPGQPAGVIAKKTGLSRPSLYGYLKHLQEKGLIAQSQKDGVKVFSAASQEKIAIVFDEHMKEIASVKAAVDEAFLEIQNGKTPDTNPRMQIFEGKKEMQHLTRDLLLHKNISARSYWPIKLMLEVLGEEFFREFNRERARRNITIQAIWPEKQAVDMNQYPYMGSGGPFLREVRIAPKDIDFSMGYWIYANKVSFVSSRKSNFGFIIENQEFANMMASQFDIIWKSSQKLDIPLDESERLFKEGYLS